MCTGDGMVCKDTMCTGDGMVCKDTMCTGDGMVCKDTMCTGDGMVCKDTMCTGDGMVCKDTMCTGDVAYQQCSRFEDFHKVIIGDLWGWVPYHQSTHIGALPYRVVHIGPHILYLAGYCTRGGKKGGREGERDIYTL